ncbi:MULTISPECIES: cysteine hydrolase family protein [Chryseobacterium]|uniref:Nicotinamidase-related amidase n=1 Tax=Chryseobacterium camelliae TaxID=1265445 RepID=A0ABU0TJ56_9FLAO|nr:MULTISPECIES: cysteine hydrolase family protein [Chryseobacterium]MDT3409066.1 nicotinamidase-related amidase [Pseudacidovorax intermedius]MDQ1097076.1 nicotinamidase-related amidase [Chryseobacterium camelliae]MDQ1101014.1 nicotinamidase-related amidase [Chryseobacterium sp. SORGH_AS_1048]MDR6084456.1 nicotinamidase-related amidase [Chryseobacterium sp. SORGH_AS_0909]MDR6132727.1 nicotinamidase-related amidase [Chryseobacterium sp. SORGH_AS_1175]
MGTLSDKKPALILIDVQKGFLDDEYWGGNRNNKNAEKTCGRLLEKWRELKLPVFHIRHSSSNKHSRLHESHPGFQFSDEVLPLPGEPVITKNVNSALIGTDLKERLDAQDIHTLVIVGITTNHCVSTTARMAGNFGYETYVVSDATAGFDRIGINGEKYDAELVHLTALANLHGEFATVWNSEKVLAELE